jgi:hypothetical protein
MKLSWNPSPTRKKKKNPLGAWLKLWSTCLTSVRLWVQIPILTKKFFLKIFWFFFGWDWNLNSGLHTCRYSTAWVTPPVHFCSAYFGDGVLWTICPSCVRSAQDLEHFSWAAHGCVWLCSLLPVCLFPVIHMLTLKKEKEKGCFKNQKIF